MLSLLFDLAYVYHERSWTHNSKCQQILSWGSRVLIQQRHSSLNSSFSFTFSCYYQMHKRCVEDLVQIVNQEIDGSCASVHPWRFARSDGTKPKATWSDLTADPAWSRRLDQTISWCFLEEWCALSYSLQFSQSYQIPLPGSQISAQMPEHLQSAAYFLSWFRACC